MDTIFAKCVDHISLAGPKGVTCQTTIERVVERPRPQLVKWLYRNCKKREPNFFKVDGDKFETAIVVASKALRERALGYSSLEHFPLQPTAWAVFEAVGRAGKDGVLQSQLAKELKIGPVMLHHYLCSLLNLKLVVRRRIVLSAKRKSKKGLPSLSSAKAASVTQTCVIALARYASSIGSITASASTSGQTTLGVSDDTEPVIHNTAVEERTELIVRLLSEAPGGIMPERDLKINVISSADGIRTRHRAFRTIRDKIVKAGLVKKVVRNCVDANGEQRGSMPCLQLVGNDDEIDENHVVNIATNDDDSKSDQENDDGVDLEKQVGSTHANGENAFNDERDTPAMLFEVDIAEQVYRAFDKAKSRGLSCPEIVSLLDGDTGNIGIEYKRMRSLMNVMENSFGLKTVQHFNASACHKRFVLKEHYKQEGNEWPPETEKNDGIVSPKKSSKSRHVGRGRTVNGNLTTLGSRRRSILLDILDKEKVILVEKIGRIIAEAEGNSTGHVDVKVSRKIVQTMIDDGLCRYVSVAKPRFGSVKKDAGILQLLVAQNVTSNGKEIRDFLARFVKRSMSTPDGRGGISSTKRTRRPSVRKSVAAQDSEDETEDVVPKLKRLKHKVIRNDSEMENLSQKTVSIRSSSQLGTGDLEGFAPMPQLSLAPEERPRKEVRTTAGVFIENPGRGPTDLRSVRLNKLRIQDHGFISARMRRCQLLHEFIVRFVMDEDFITSNAIVTHSTMEIAGSVEDMGKFGYDEVLRSMNVGLFANLFGIASFDRMLTEDVKKIPMKDAPEEIRSELNGRLPVEQTRILFKLLWELGLVYSTSLENWFLRGAGVFRDFGKGLPDGYTAHSILFNSYSAVNAFWAELESLSNSANVVAGYVPNPQSAVSFAKEILGLKGGIDGIDGITKEIQGPDLGLIYFPSSWIPPRRGNVGTIIEDELTMEMVLQKIIVGWEDDGKMPKDVSSWEFGPLPWMPVSVLYDNRVLLDRGYRRRRRRILQLCDVEYFVQYARKRTIRKVARNVVVLAGKPNNNVSDYFWLQKSNLILKENTRKRRVRTQLQRAEKRQRKQCDVNFPGPIQNEKKNTSLLNFDDSVHLLAMHVRMKALVTHWKEKKLELPLIDNKDYGREILTKALGRPENEYNRIIEELRDNNVVNRYAETVENCLVHEMRLLKISPHGDGQLEEVPDKLLDSYGQELILKEVFCAVLNESKLLFDRKSTQNWPIALSRRRNILRRLRSHMTGLNGPASIPNTTKSGWKRQRARLLTREDKDEDLRYGIIKVKDDDPKWMTPCSISGNPSSCRRILVKQILIAILTESDTTFDPRSALLLLSRFSVSNILQIRNALYDEKYISIRKDNRRAFEIHGRIKRAETPFTDEGHKMFATALSKMNSSSGGARNKVSGSEVLDKVLSLNDGMNSQIALMALTQTVLFRAKDSCAKLTPQFRDGKLGAEFTLAEPRNCDEVSMQEAVKSNSVSQYDENVEFDSKRKDLDTNQLQPAKLNPEINDDDRIKIESGWYNEMNKRVVRERNMLVYYQSRTNSVFGDIFKWILESGYSGLKSNEIQEKCAEREYSNEEVVGAIKELLEEYVIHRFGFGNKESSSGRAPAVYMSTSHAWRFAVAPIMKIGSGRFRVNWDCARPISPWITSNGLYNSDLIKSVQVHILNSIARNPGINEVDLVASVCSRVPSLSERAVLDAVSAMLRARRISRKVYSTIRREATIFGYTPFSSVQDNKITSFPDGPELTSCQFIFSYSAPNNAFGALLNGFEIEQMI